MHISSSKWRRRSAGAVTSAALLATLVAGCGESGPKLYPVEGKVTLDGKPAGEGAVIFHEGMKRLAGGIRPDGTYSIMTNRVPGAPAGNYKVAVVVTMTPKDAQGNPIDLPKTLSNNKFINPQTTPFEIEVTESPPAGAYDLAVTR